LFDREEIGSEGDAGAQARFYRAFLRRMLSVKGFNDTEQLLDEIIDKSTVLSADVTALLTHLIRMFMISSMLLKQVTVLL